MFLCVCIWLPRWTLLYWSLVAPLCLFCLSANHKLRAKCGVSTACWMSEADASCKWFRKVETKCWLSPSTVGCEISLIISNLWMLNCLTAFDLLCLKFTVILNFCCFCFPVSSFQLCKTFNAVLPKCLVFCSFIAVSDSLQDVQTYLWSTSTVYLCWSSERLRQKEVYGWRNLHSHT